MNPTKITLYLSVLLGVIVGISFVGFGILSIVMMFEIIHERVM